MARDMSQAQYVAALTRNGFVTDGFLGYWRHTKTGWRISELNCDGTRREKLAYILKRHADLEKGRTAL